MLGISWIEMMVIAAVALIVVGPKDLPHMLRQLGHMMGAARRMSNEFRREINKVAAMDDVREIKKSISDPLRKTSAEISREFNAIGKDGKVRPSGVIKPDAPGKESVDAQIRARAGLTGTAAGAAKIAASGPARETDAAEALAVEAPVAVPQDEPLKLGAADPAPAQPRQASAKAAKPKSPAKPKASVKAAAPRKARTADKAAQTGTAETSEAKPAKPVKTGAASKSAAKNTTARKTVAKAPKPAPEPETPPTTTAAAPQGDQPGAAADDVASKA